MAAIGTIQKLSIQQIVVATDFTSASTGALDCAIAIAKHYGSKIILVHAVEMVPQDQPGQGAGHAELHRLSDAQWRLVTETRKCAALQCEWHLLKGTVPQVVEQFLAIDHIDLIVVATHADRPFHKSSAEHIFRRVRCPVLALGPSIHSEKSAWNPRCILLATDLQSDEFRTMMYATALAQQHNARLKLLHVTLPSASAYPGDSEVMVRTYYNSRLRQLAYHLQGGSSAMPDVWVEFDRDPVAGIVRAATRNSADLLILSVHPNAPLTLHFGHIAHRIVTAAPCPTLIVQRTL